MPRLATQQRTKIFAPGEKCHKIATAVWYKFWYSSFASTNRGHNQTDCQKNSLLLGVFMTSIKAVVGGE